MSARRLSRRTVIGCSMVLLLVIGAVPWPAAAQPTAKPAKADELLIVDCLLPGQIRRLGRQVTFLAPRRPMKTSARDCEIRGGEYVAWDRASYATALKVWLPLANEGDPAAQTYVGEIYEKGLGLAPNYAEAERWYRRAAEAGYSRAAVNLGYLYEQGLGVPKDQAQAVAWYRRAAGTSEAVFRIEPAASPRPQPATLPPTIEIVEPELKAAGGAALPEVFLQSPATQITVVGRVVAPAGLRAVTINDSERTVDGEQRFSAQIAVATPEQRVRIVAVDQEGRSSKREFLVRQHTVSRAETGVRRARETRPALGNYHALVIGNDDYRSLPRLGGAAEGARNVARLLREEYGFQVVVLTNASRYDVLASLNDLRQRLDSKDNLLIYYAGHGQSDPDGHGYWLPVDGEPDQPASWIANAAITEFLSAMNVRQVLVATDACYAGTLSRGSVASAEAGSEQARVAVIEGLAKRRSRVVMTSGRCERAVAAGRSESSFARSLVDVLESNRDVLPGQELFALLRSRMEARDRPETPGVLQYAPIRYAGHEAGDFVFVRATRN